MIQTITRRRRLASIVTNDAFQRSTNGFVLGRERVLIASAGALLGVGPVANAEVLAASSLEAIFAQF